MNTKIELIWLADKLDRVGMTTEANTIDLIIKQGANGSGDSISIFNDDSSSSEAGQQQAGQQQQQAGFGHPIPPPEGWSSMQPGDAQSYEGYSMSDLVEKMKKTVASINESVIHNEDVNLNEDVREQLSEFTNIIGKMLWHAGALAVSHCQEGPIGETGGQQWQQQGAGSGNIGDPTSAGGPIGMPDPDLDDPDPDDPDSDDPDSDDPRRRHGPQMSQSIRNVGNVNITGLEDLLRESEKEHRNK